MSLVDYRIHPGRWPAVIGELLNSSNQTVDSPSTGIHYPGEDGVEYFSWLSPTIPVVHGGESVPVYGPIPSVAFSRDLTEKFKFVLCSKAEPGEYTEALGLHVFEVVPEADAYAAHAYWYHAHVWNRGEQTIEDFVVKGIVRDSAGRIAGLTPQYRLPPIPPDDNRRVRIQANERNERELPASPFPLLVDDQYSVEIRAVPYLYDRATNRGCEFPIPQAEQ